MYRHIDQMKPGMAYVPVQEFHTLFEPCKALNAGTVFPELCKPFCGKRGGRR
ncbi:MAG TPA: spore coat associated protein CotJA [Candidatus Ruminococcus avistercoris]|nr:spore coat associated protein CotJA [Candidatus Ruminococcus avistercoris]